KPMKEDVMKELVRIFLPRFALAILISLGFALPCAQAFGDSPAEPPGTDVFVAPREAVLREKPLPSARIVGKLPQGTSLRLLDARDRYVRVESPTPASPPAWIAREVTVLFAPGDTATRDMVAVGRSLGRSDANRRLAACVLLRASIRLREAKTPDPEVEVLLGETVEDLALRAGPYPGGLGIVEDSGPAAPKARYDGSAFQRAADLLAADSSPATARIRERAAAGLLRARYPVRSSSFQALLQESAAWLQFVESAEDPGVLSSAAERG